MAAGSMNFGLADLYPGMGFWTTRGETVPEADDQLALVDDEDAAHNNPELGKSQLTHRSLWVSIAVIFGIVFLLSWKR